jgi:solute carrier family 8 (sodium/calcium exchanger)
MALGSSAPEILLSVIELFRNEFHAGALGPSTIVGSAAFNLFMIIAVCVSSIPEGEVRFIKEVPVYFVTSFFSIFAYVWLIFILQGHTPHIVDPGEGLATFLFFPVLIFLAYLADVGYFSKKKQEKARRGSLISADMSKEELAEETARIRREHGDISDEQLQKIIKIEARAHATRAHYRVAAIRNLIGGKRVPVDKFSRSMTNEMGRLASGFTGMFSPKSKKKVVPVAVEDVEAAEEKKDPVFFEFEHEKLAVLENAGCVKITVKRYGDTKGTAKVNYRTYDGSAHKDQDYVPVEDTLTFASGETKQTFKVNIVDDTAYEEDEEFYVELFDPIAVPENANQSLMPPAQLGSVKATTVVIIDDDLPGVIDFPSDSLHVEEGVNDTEKEIHIIRRNGATGTITCKYTTEDDTAAAPDDYDQAEGVVSFEPGVTTASIMVNIKARGRYDRIERFRVILSEPTGGAKFPEDADGGPDSNILTVFIKSQQMAKDRIDRIMSTMQSNWSKAKLGSSNWREQFVQAIYVNGGDDDDEEEVEPPTYQDYIMHVITLPFKVIFAFIPPTDYCDGWLCFCVSLGMIGIVTAVIGDLAELLGCVINVWPPEVTAITLVALGTSMPDTFASKTAAMQDPYADASVGNVTGSNSVNVFLGLGLPWMMGSLYWTHRHPDAKWISLYGDDTEILESVRTGEYASFIVKAGSLAPSVLIFSCCAVFCVLLLCVRRRVFGGELGGPKRWAHLTSAVLACVWVFYVCLASYFAIKETNRTNS